MSTTVPKTVYNVLLRERDQLRAALDKVRALWFALTPGEMSGPNVHEIERQLGVILGALNSSSTHEMTCPHGIPVPYSLAHGSLEIGWEEVCEAHGDKDVRD